MFHVDWAIAVREGAYDGHHVTSHSKLAYTLQFDKGSANVKMNLVRGAGYITGDVLDLSPSFYTGGEIVSVADANGTALNTTGKSDKFVITLKDQEIWVLYTSAAVDITINSSHLNFLNKFNGTFRLACIGDTLATLPTFDKYSDAIPTTATLEHQVRGRNAIIRFLYNTRSLKGEKAGGPPLIFALPHHLEVLKKPTIENVSFRTIKGNVTAIADSVWEMREKLTGIKWQDPLHANVKPSWREATRQALYKDVEDYASSNRTAE